MPLLDGQRRKSRKVFRPLRPTLTYISSRDPLNQLLVIVPSASSFNLSTLPDESRCRRNSLATVFFFLKGISNLARLSDMKLPHLRPERELVSIAARSWDSFHLVTFGFADQHEVCNEANGHSRRIQHHDITQNLVNVYKNWKYLLNCIT